MNDRFKWLILFFFILELQNVKIKVESETLDQFKQKTAAHWRKKWFILITNLIISLVVICLQYLRRILEFSNKIKEYLFITEMVVRSVKSPFDLYLFYLYITIVMFFATMKKSRMENERLTCWNK